MPSLTNKAYAAANKQLAEKLQWTETLSLKCQRENETLKAKNEELQKQIAWMRQLSQNLSEAVCAYMRSR